MNHNIKLLAGLAALFSPMLQAAAPKRERDRDVARARYEFAKHQRTAWTLAKGSQHVLRIERERRKRAA